MSCPVIGALSPDPVAVLLNTGFMRFSSVYWIDGLAKVDGKRLDLLAVVALAPGRGDFKKFIQACKRHYSSISVWVVENEQLEAALRRYGFVPTCEPMHMGEIVHGLTWQRTYAKDERD